MRERLGFPENFEAQGFRTHVAPMTLIPAPRPRRKHSLISPRSFVSPRRKSREDPTFSTGRKSGQAIVRGVGERPMIYIYTLSLIHI